MNQDKIVWPEGNPTDWYGIEERQWDLPYLILIITSLQDPEVREM